MRRFRRAGSAKDGLIQTRRSRKRPASIARLSLATVRIKFRRAVGFQCVYYPSLRVGSRAYKEVIYEKLKFQYEILDKLVLPYHLCAPGFSAKPAFSAEITAYHSLPTIVAPVLH
jgi:hypothetical protein